MRFFKFRMPLICNPLSQFLPFFFMVSKCCKLVLNTETLAFGGCRRAKIHQMAQKLSFVHFTFRIDLWFIGSSTYVVLPITSVLQNVTSMLCFRETLQPEPSNCISSTFPYNVGCKFVMFIQSGVVKCFCHKSM